MEQLMLHVPKVYEKRYLLLEDYTSIDHIYVEDGNGGGFIAVETFMLPEPETQSVVVNYQSDEVTLFLDKESKFLNQLQRRKIPFEPVHTQFFLHPKEKNHQSKRR
ncbi:hypothetical protein AB1K89_14505 [Sporosarcina sp. 179-K 8C2 HS]|uniref:hypothetical protein n=1 Tax=Sporosarcina sp. 179-K 8C2 HS TaxID=3142387 RepID=UPI0039A27955